VNKHKEAKHIRKNFAFKTLKLLNTKMLNKKCSLGFSNNSNFPDFVIFLAMKRLGDIGEVTIIINY